MKTREYEIEVVWSDEVGYTGIYRIEAENYAAAEKEAIDRLEAGDLPDERDSWLIDYASQPTFINLPSVIFVLGVHTNHFSTMSGIEFTREYGDESIAEIDHRFEKAFDGTQSHLEFSFFASLSDVSEYFSAEYEKAKHDNNDMERIGQLCQQMNALLKWQASQCSVRG